MSSSSTLADVRTNQSNALHMLVRELSAAVLQLDPTEIVDPRGLILDVTPDHEWVARVRTGARQWAFAPTDNEWAPGRPTSWRWLNPADDEALPGRAVMTDARLVRQVTGLDEAHVEVVSYRMGRRATVRVVGYAGDERCVRYVKLLRKKTMRRALRTYGLLAQIDGDVLVNPNEALPELGLLVFDEVEGRSLHEVLWSADGESLPDLADQVRTLCDRLTGIPIPAQDEVLPCRGLESEKKSALDMLGAGGRVRPELARLSRVVQEMDLPSEASDPSRFMHADLHDKQIFATSDGLKVIDCEGSARGPAIVDRTNLVEHVRLRGFQGAQFGHEAAAVLQPVLGLERDDPGVRALTALTRARLAGVYALRPWWWWLSRDLEVDALRLLNSNEGST